jgi:hypothetical protein
LNARAGMGGKKAKGRMQKAKTAKASAPKKKAAPKKKSA